MSHSNKKEKTGGVISMFLCIAVVFTIAGVSGIDRAIASVDVNFDILEKAARDKNSKVATIIENKQSVAKIGEVTDIEYTNVKFTHSISISHSMEITSKDNATLDGDGKNSLFRFTNPDKGKFMDIGLQSLIFHKGFSGKGEESGGAIHIGEGMKVTFTKAYFSKNKANFSGGAIYSRGNEKVRNILVFNKESNFTSNENDGVKTDIMDESDGGAIYSINSDLTFNGITYFSKNQNLGLSGGAIYAKASNLIFEKSVIFSDNGSGRQGGAITYSGDRGDSLVFEEKVDFTNNKVDGIGGALCFMGNGGKINFKKEVIFYNNISNNGGGAINGSGNNLSLIFDGEATFRGNISDSTSAGAIMLQSDYDNRICKSIFNGQTIFEGNRAKTRGGAMYINKASVEFRSGLVLAGNITGRKNSGAIHMEGSNDANRASVTIVQNDINKPSEFKENISNNESYPGKGKNAFYLWQHAELNFNAKSGNIDLYDAIDGFSGKEDKIVTITGNEGWFNVKEDGTIRNVDLNNRGNLGLANSKPVELHLENFSNSGRIKFGIFPNEKCDLIEAKSITLEAGTILEIVVIGASDGIYNIMISEVPIIVAENIIIDTCCRKYYN
jgi:predicted outer membrane repeat protein